MKIRLIYTCGILAGIATVIVIGAAAFVDVNQFRPTLEHQMSAALGRNVTLGTIRLSLLSGSVSVNDVTIADDPSFSASPFVTAKSVAVGVEILPLVFSKSLRVQSFVLESPHVALLRTPAGVWNFSSLAGASASTPTASSSSSSPLSISVRKLTIKDGRITVGVRSVKSKDRSYENVRLEASDLSYVSEFPFHVKAATPGGGVFTLNGTAGPLNQTDMAETPLRATVDVQHVDLAATGFLDASSGLAGLVELQAKLTSDGRRASLEGVMKAARLQLVPGGAPSRVPVEVKYQSDYDVKHQSGVLRQGDVHVGKAAASLTGSFSNAGDAPSVRMKLAGRQMAATELQSALPAVGVTLPSGASLREGTLDLQLSIDGPVDHLVITGPITMSNARLSGFDLGAKMKAISAFGAVPKTSDTVVQMLHADVRVAPEGIRTENLSLIVPTIGNLSGAGTILSNSAMDFRMLAKLANGTGAAASLSRVASLGSGDGAIPFRIQGTTSSPVFVPDLRGAAAGLATPEGASGAAKMLSGLFGRKKK